MKNEATIQNLQNFDNKSLLIVDDDNPFRERLSRAMEKKGFEVLQAESVKKGIDTVKLKKLGFAVVDLRLADGNGLEVVKEIQTSNSSSRIIMLTGYVKLNDSFFKIFTKLTLAVSTIYIFGILWLGTLIGWDKPIFSLGVAPFLLAEIFKILLLSLLVKKLAKLRSFI